MTPDERTAALMEAEDPTTEMPTVETARTHEEARAAYEREKAPQPSTILDALVARREEMAHEDHELILEIPGYRAGGYELVVRYRYPEIGAKGLAGMEMRAVQAGGEEAVVNVQIDYLVACCDDIFLRDSEGGTRPLEEGDDVPPLKFGKRLADLFHIEIPEDEKAKARFVCRSIFSPGFNTTGKWEGDIVLTNQSQALQAWLQRIGSQTNEEFSGE